MVAGIEFRREADSALLLTNNLANPIVRQQGTSLTTANTLTNSGLQSVLLISYPDASITSRPLLVLAAPFAGFLLGHSRSGGNWNWAVVVAAPEGTPVSWMIFDEPSGLVTAGLGLEIYADEPGSPIIFNTDPDTKPLRIERVVTGTGATPADVVLPVGLHYGIAFGKFAGWREWVGGAKDPGGFPDPDYYVLDTFSHVAILVDNEISWTTFTLEKAPIVRDGVPEPLDMTQERDWHNRQIIVCDVTGYV